MAGRAVWGEGRAARGDEARAGGWRRRATRPGEGAAAWSGGLERDIRDWGCGDIGDSVHY